MPTYRTAVVDAVHNDEELRLNLDLLEEQRKRAAIREAKAKLKMIKYYNARVRGVTFRVGLSLGLARFSLLGGGSPCAVFLLYHDESIDLMKALLFTFVTGLSKNLLQMHVREECLHPYSRSRNAGYLAARSALSSEDLRPSHIFFLLPEDFVYCSNEASHVMDEGKLGPKWEGPYEVMEALGDGAYKLRSMDGAVLPQTWNIANLKKCYL
ncbi:hypothetical protein Tco_1349796 [Tanacetum coccineum]